LSCDFIGKGLARFGAGRNLSAPPPALRQTMFDTTNQKACRIMATWQQKKEKPCVESRARPDGDMQFKLDPPARFY